MRTIEDYIYGTEVGRWIGQDGEIRMTYYVAIIIVHDIKRK